MRIEELKMKSQLKSFTSWQIASISAIANGLLEYEAQQLCLGKSVNIDQCKKWISVNKYPFGLRENHPYKVWLREIKLAGEFLSTGIGIKHYQMWRQTHKKSRKTNNWNEVRKVGYNPNQFSLF